MELKKLILVIWQRKKIFLFFLFSTIFLSLVWFSSQPKRYSVVFSIDVTRENYSKTEDYRYDQFYRFQADEKFAENIVNWFNDPAFKREIENKSNENNFSFENLEVKKLSNGYLQVFLLSRNKENYPQAIEAIRIVLENKIHDINKKANDPEWFSVLIGEPTISKKEFDFKLIFLGAFLFGFVFGLFASLFHYYFQSNENRN